MAAILRLHQSSQVSCFQPSQLTSSCCLLCKVRIGHRVYHTSPTERIAIICAYGHKILSDLLVAATSLPGQVLAFYMVCCVTFVDAIMSLLELARSLLSPPSFDRSHLAALLWLPWCFGLFWFRGSHDITGRRCLSLFWLSWVFLLTWGPLSLIPRPLGTSRKLLRRTDSPVGSCFGCFRNRGLLFRQFATAVIIGGYQTNLGEPLDISGASFLHWKVTAAPDSIFGTVGHLG